MTTAILLEQIVEQPVILETFNRNDLSTKRRPSSKLENSGSTTLTSSVDVTKLEVSYFIGLTFSCCESF